MLIKWLIKTIAALNANNRPGEVAAAVTLGVILAMIPSANLFWIAILAATFFIKINFGAEMLVIALFKPLAPLFDPVFDFAGDKILSADFLSGFFTSLYNMPVFPYTKFNNTVVTGSLATMIILSVPLFLLFRILIKLYREKIRDKILSSRIIRKISSLPLISKIIWIFKKGLELKR